MSENPKVDVIIFGATGYTGKLVTEKFIKLNRKKHSFAVAGRNHQKLKELLVWATDKSGEDVSNTSIIVADCSDENSLNSMASQGKVIINCSGPYELYGEQVVKACIENGTHQVDVSAESEYMEKIQLKYHELAESKRVYIVSACGFDSIPADFGVIHFIENFNGVVNSIESHFMKKSELPSPLVSIGTWKSATGILGLTDRKLQQFKRPKLEPRLKQKWALHRSRVFDNKISIPFLGSDKSVVYRTQNFMYENYGQRPAQYFPYLIVDSFGELVRMIVMGSFVLTLGYLNCGQRLLARYPQFFSVGWATKTGPTEEERLKTSACIRFEGEGWSPDIADKFQQKHEINVPTNKKVVTQVSFIDFGYGFTATTAVSGALTILNELENMPSNGGVYTPGGAFSRTSFMKQLQDIGVSIKVLESNQK